MGKHTLTPLGRLVTLGLIVLIALACLALLATTVA
jgi:hypothetical protein